MAEREDGGCGQLLAELASEYERSRNFLAQLEQSLKHAPEPDVESSEFADSPEAVPEQPPSSPHGVAGLKQRFSKLFVRRPGHSKNETLVVAPRRASVVHLVFGAPDEPVQQQLPRRASSFYGPLRPTGASVSAQQTARASMELRQQGLRSDVPEPPLRESAGSLPSAVRRRSLEELSFSSVHSANLDAACGGNSFKQSKPNLGSPLSSTPVNSSSLPEILPQSPRARLQQRLASSGVQAAVPRRTSFGPSASLAPAGDSALLVKASSMRRTSFNMGSSLSGNLREQQHQACPVSPVTGANSVALKPSADEMLASRPSSFKLPPFSGPAAGVTSTRATSSSSAAAMLPGRAGDGDHTAGTAVLQPTLCGDSGDTVSAPTGTRVSATSLPSAAAGGGTAETSVSGGSLSQPWVARRTPMRSRSLLCMASSDGARSAAPQATAAGAAAPNAASGSIRLPVLSGDVDALGEAEARGNRRLSNVLGACSGSGEDGAQGTFQGTMHLI